MRWHERHRSNRPFEWSVQPLFSRGLLVAPPGPFRPRHGSPSDQARRTRRGRPILAVGLSGSVLIHWLVIVGWGAGRGDAPPPWSLGTRSMSAAVPMEVVQVRPPAPPDLIEPGPTAFAVRSRPTLEIDPPRVAARRTLAASTGPVATRAVRSGSVAGFGASVLEGMGRGLGGDVDPPKIDEVFVQPRAKSVLRTWSPHRSLIGSEILVRVHTDATGRATGLVELIPSTGHDQTDREIQYRVLRLEYWPATVNGEPVQSWAEISFAFCFDGMTAASPPSPGFGVGEPCAEKPKNTPDRI